MSTNSLFFFTVASGAETNLKGAANFFVTPSTSLVLKVQLVVLVSAFVMVSQYSLVSFLFAVLLTQSPPCLVDRRH